MIELELLGLHPDGDRLSLNDAEGNRYILPITDELRAALRKDRQSETPGAEPKPITPREIQAHFRAGMTVAEVSEISSLPAAQLAGLANPIMAERQYTAQTARSYRQGQDVGGLTLEELVISRLVPRGVTASSIAWDATRTGRDPWVLQATYEASDTEHVARWRVNTRSQSVEALNDEAVWLTETQIPTPTSPWRPLNTPKVARTEESRASAPSSKTPVADETPAVEGSQASVTAINDDLASSTTPLSIDDVLASLDSQRGQSRPMPEEAFDGAHPAASEPENATDATILAFPKMSAVSAESTSSASSAESAQSAPSAHTPVLEEATESEQGIEAPKESDQAELDLGKDATTPKEDKPKDKKRRNRPSMPSWDEIVFGAPKSDK